MFSDLVPHDAYKHPGEAGLAPVPRHWEVKPMRAILRARSKRNRADLPLLSVARERGVFIRSADDDNHNAIPDDLTNYKVALAGDLVINKMKAWQGSLGLAPCDGLVSPAYFVYGVDFDNRYYLQALLRSRRYVDLFAAASDGVRIGQWDLAINRFRGLPVLVPSAVEQAAIVKYLAHAHRRIDRAMGAKRKLISLLEEQKQSIINQAVTRGLDLTASVEDSGVPWLGAIPAHWRAVRFKQRVGFQEGPGIMAADFRDAGVPLLRISCMAGEKVDLHGCNFLDADTVEARWSKFRVRADDYLLSASGSTGAVKPVGESAIGAVPYTGLIRLWPRDLDVNMEFVRLSMTAAPFMAQIDQAKSGVGIEHFGPTHLKRMWIALPPLEEQVAIVTNVAAATAAIDASAAVARREVELLREFRIRLTSDVATGQVDVRNIAATLPDLVPEEAAVDVNGPNDDLGDEVHELLEDVDG